MRRVLFLVVLVTIALFAIGGRSSEKRHHASAQRFAVHVNVRAVHVESLASALYDDDGDDGDDDEIGLACPPIQLDDDDVAPQPVASIHEDTPLLPSEPMQFHASTLGLGPAHGHARTEDRPPRS